MLRISKMADYATVIMVYLARNQQTLANVKTIANATHISEPTVSKLLKRLTKAELLESQRGAVGGYRLKCSAHGISVAKIISVIEERTGLTECSFGHSDCSIQAVCTLQGNWQLINRAIETALDSVSLADLAKPNLTLGNIPIVTKELPIE